MNVRQAGLDAIRPNTQMRLVERADIERLAFWPLLMALLIHLAFFLPLPFPAASQRAGAPPAEALDVDVIDNKSPASADKAEKNQAEPVTPPPGPPIPDAAPTPPPAPAADPPIAEKRPPPPDQFPAASDKPADAGKATPEAVSPPQPDPPAQEPTKADTPPVVAPAPSPLPLLESQTGEAATPAPPPLPAQPVKPAAKAEPARPEPARPAPPKVERRETAKPQPHRQTAEQPHEDSISTVPAPQPSRQPPARSLQDDQPSIGYIRQVAAFLNRVKTYPEKARAAGQQGVVVVRFTISRAGQVGSINVLRSSGSEALDEAGLALVRRAAPFPPLPDDFSGPLLTLTLPLSFGLR